jgi:hypothetical protein
MKSAWEIAYEGVKKFGGQVKEYFADALRIAWSLFKKGGKALETKKEIFAAKVNQYVSAAKGIKKYKNDTKEVNAANLIAMFNEEKADGLIKLMSKKADELELRVKQLQATVIRTKRFEKMYHLITLKKDQKVESLVKKDAEGYHVIFGSGFYRVIENGVEKYIQTVPGNTSMRELDKETVIRFKR